MNIGSFQILDDLDGIMKRSIIEPSLVVFRERDENTIQQMLVTAEEVLQVPSSKILDGFVALMAVYYAFDVQYPNFTLFFLQDILMQATDDAPRPTRYSAFISSLSI